MNTENFRKALCAVLDQGMRRKDLADRAGVPYSVLSDFLNGRQSDIKLSTALKLWPFVYGPGISSKEAKDGN